MAHDQRLMFKQRSRPYFGSRLPHPNPRPPPPLWRITTLSDGQAHCSVLPLIKCSGIEQTSPAEARCAHSDGMTFVCGVRLEGHSIISLSVQTYPTRRFLPADDSLVLRWSGCSSQFIDPPQDVPKQVAVPSVLFAGILSLIDGRRPAPLPL